MILKAIRAGIGWVWPATLMIFFPDEMANPKIDRPIIQRIRPRMSIPGYPEAVYYLGVHENCSRQSQTFQLVSDLCVVIQVQIIQLDEDRGEFVLKATFDHPYPTTKIMWIPDQVTLIIHVHKNYSKKFPILCIYMHREGSGGKERRRIKGGSVIYAV